MEPHLSHMNNLAWDSLMYLITPQKENKSVSNSYKYTKEITHTTMAMVPYCTRFSYRIQRTNHHTSHNGPFLKIRLIALQALPSAFHTAQLLFNHVCITRRYWQ